MTKGKLIVLEGMDGSGKTTVIEFLKQQLPSEEYVFASTLGTTEVGHQLRTLQFHTPMQNTTNVLLMLAAMNELMQTVILPTLESGKHVILDRFTLSTYVYQVAAQEGSEKANAHALWAEVKRQVIDKWKLPDLVLILDIDLETALARIGQGDLFEQRGKEYLSIVHRAYRRVASLYNFETVSDAFGIMGINANVPKEILCTQILNLVLEKVKEKDGYFEAVK